MTHKLTFELVITTSGPNVTPAVIEDNLAHAIARQIKHVGLSAERDEDHVEGFALNLVKEPQS